MAYQQQAGLGADGIVWPQTLDQLILDWQRAMGYAPAPSESPALRSVCRIYREANGAEYIQNCDYHRGIADMAAALPYATGDGNALRAYKQIRMLWQTERYALQRMDTECTSSGAGCGYRCTGDLHELPDGL